MYRKTYKYLNNRWLFNVKQNLEKYRSSLLNTSKKYTPYVPKRFWLPPLIS